MIITRRRRILEKKSNLEDAVKFADNPEARCPCVLLLDISGSMQGERINALNAGLATFKNELTRDSLASRRVELAIVTFGDGVRIEQDFVTIDQFVPPRLMAGGPTPMGQAIESGLNLVEDRKRTYREYGIAYYRPWVFLITDGKPEGESEDLIAQASRRIRTIESQKGAAVFAVGVENADMVRLAEITVRSPIKLEGLKFAEMFLWLSASMQAVSHSDKGEVMVALPPVGWGHVSL